jgi:hypothetical protein
VNGQPTGGAASTLDRLLDEVEARENDAPDSLEQEVLQKPAAGGDALSALLSSPQALQLMSKLPALLGAMGKGEGGSEATRQSRPDTVALLCALRPYLNERRRSMVDQVIRLHKLQALLQTVRTE